MLNLGHAVLPETDPDVLTRVVELARAGTQIQQLRRNLVTEALGIGGLPRGGRDP
ncbi:MAG: hypothetical protein ACRDRO_19305 [Pseudonocardiaceae bacterium]